MSEFSNGATHKLYSHEAFSFYPLQLQEAGVEHARAAISLLGAAHELYARGPARPGRLLYHVGGLMVSVRVYPLTQDLVLPPPAAALGSSC
jgi:hypothetical protein